MKRETLKTITLSLVLIFAIILWIIGGPSLSYFDGSEHKEIYYLMHGFMIIFFALNTDIKRYWVDYALPFLALGVLAYNMWDNPMTHNIFTGALIITALFTVIFNTKEALRMWNRWIIAGLVVIGFGTAYFLEIYSILIGELIVMITIAMAKLREIYGQKFLKF